MTCERIEELLPAYLDGDLADDDRARVEAHLAGCPFCQAFVHDLRRAEAWGAAWPSLPAEMNARLTTIDAGVGRRLRRERRRPEGLGAGSVPRISSSAVAIVLVVVLGALALTLGQAELGARVARSHHPLVAPAPPTAPASGNQIGLHLDQLPDVVRITVLTARKTAQSTATDPARIRPVVDALAGARFVRPGPGAPRLFDAGYLVQFTLRDGTSFVLVYLPGRPDANVWNGPDEWWEAPGLDTALATLRPPAAPATPPSGEAIPRPIPAAWSGPTASAPPASSSALPAPVVSLAADPDPGQTVYALLETNELDRSDDGGRTWERLPLPAAITDDATSQPAPGRPDDVPVVPQHDVVIPAGQPRRVFVVANRVLYRSDDRGATWKALLDAVYAWTVADGKGDTLYAWHEPGALGGTTQSAARGLYRSTDGGATWTEVFRAAFPPLLGDHGCPCTHEGITALLADPENPARLYAGTDFGVYESADGGKSWRKSDRGLPPTQRAYRWTPILAAGSGGNVYAVDEVFPDAATGSAEVARLGPGGSSWTVVGAGALAQLRDPGDAFHGVKTLVADPGRPGDLYLGTTRGLLVTHDGGATWQPVPIDGVHAVYRIAVRPTGPSAPAGASPARLYGWTDAGFRAWTDAGGP